MKDIRESAKFGKEIRILLKRGKDVGKIECIIETLARSEKLSVKNKDHALVGNWAGYRECYIEPDWLLIYKAAGEVIFLARTGTLSDLFG